MKDTALTSHVEERFGLIRRQKKKPFAGKIFGLSLIILLISAVGCSGLKIKGENGTTHHIILGLGVVSVNQVNEKAMVVSDTTSIGIALSTFPGTKLGMGYSSGTVTSVSTNAKDVRAEISKLPFGPLIVDVKNAELENSYRSKKKEGENDCHR